MAFNISVPWKIHLSGTGDSAKNSWWSRRKYRDDTGAHPTLMKEQDLEHLGALHERVQPAKRRKKAGFLAELFSRTD